MVANSMPRLFKNWRQRRRYSTTVRELRSLPPAELRALGIRPDQIDRLACAAATF